LAYLHRAASGRVQATGPESIFTPHRSFRNHRKTVNEKLSRAAILSFWSN
jgi:hypothetical protein